MLYEELKEAISNAQCSVSSVASDVLDNVLDRYEEDDEDIDEWDVWDAIDEEIDNYFIYYSDAWDYLQETCTTDFEEAIHEGHTGICGFACYYLRDEIAGELHL